MAQNPVFTPKSRDDVPPPPVLVVVRELMTEEGSKLELLTRTNHYLARACQLGTIFGSMIKDVDGTVGIGYISARIEQVKRLAVSMDGKGREELINTLHEGGSLPAEYYQSAEKRGSAEFTRFSHNDEQ